MDKVSFAFGFVMIVGIIYSAGSALIDMDHRDNQNFQKECLSQGGVYNKAIYTSRSFCTLKGE